jgi:hypothetical protein
MEVTSKSQDRFRSGRAGSRLDVDVRADIESLHLRGSSLRAIERKLALDGTPVAYNTIRAIAAELDALSDPSGNWRLEAPPGLGSQRPDAVMEVRVKVLQVTDGRVRFVTKRVADWIAALRTAAPWLSPWSCYILARRYVAFEGQHRDTADLDQVLIFAQLGGAPANFMVDHPDLDALLRQLTWTESVTASGIGLHVNEGSQMPD